LAEISKFTSAERREYENSLNVFRDFKNFIDTAIKTGEEQRSLAIAKELKALGMSKEFIKQATGIDID